MKLLQSLLFVTAICHCRGADQSGGGWMKALDGKLPIHRLSIPGSHDSGALLEPFPGTAKCQSLTIAEQLAAGVRFLDIRCRHVANTFDIYHGAIDQKLTFEGVLGSVSAFLTANSGECVILSIKEEFDPANNTRSFEQTFDTYVAKDPDRWWLKSALPRLDQVRGKIVLFRRFPTSSEGKGIDASKWPDNTKFTAPPLRVQDHYRPANATAKWREFESLLKEAATAESDTLFVNFSSGSVSTLGIPSITAISTPMNQQITIYFAARPKGHHGIIVMDFVDVGRCRLIYETNLGSR